MPLVSGLLWKLLDLRQDGTSDRWHCFSTVGTEAGGRNKSKPSRGKPRQRSKNTANSLKTWMQITMKLHFPEMWCFAVFTCWAVRSLSTQIIHQNTVSISSFTHEQTTLLFFFLFIFSSQVLVCHAVGGSTSQKMCKTANTHRCKRLSSALWWWATLSLMAKVKLWKRAEARILKYFYFGFMC